MHLYNIDIDVAGQAAIQSHFFLAKVLPALRGAEIYEAIVYWLFQFVCVGAGQKNPGYMCFL
jgi:hypothetical protein